VGGGAVDRFCFIDEQGNEIVLTTDEIDPDIFPAILRPMLKPIGGFCYPAENFKRLPFSKMPFYVKDWLPKQGRMELYGKPKVGKSILCMQLARCLSEGEPFLGQPTTSCRVLYVQSELGVEVLQTRMQGTGKDYDNVFVGTTFSLKLDSKIGQELLGKAIEATESNVVILDPLYKMMEGDENEAGDIRKITDYLDSLIDDYKELGLSFGMIHHAGKDLAKGGRGSNALQAWVDAYIELSRVQAAGQGLTIRLMPKDLRHAELPPEAVEAELKKGEFVVTGNYSTVREQILDYFHKAGEGMEVPTGVIEAALGASHKQVADKLKELVDEGELIKPSWGHYALAGKGEEDD
jgi:hypothetical protein